MEVVEQGNQDPLFLSCTPTQVTNYSESPTQDQPNKEQPTAIEAVIPTNSLNSFWARMTAFSINSINN
jgi:hypothetical protein